ncbi:protein of unknown function [Pseudodesulfovibrio piezophilus C1TLV30]|uniref:Uncharacterized protein n=1 Tax=Pseudodesulfovibrio piezophilus (strain DSM 21447 / JCM 15486 / C1TLV30) TaxID=1322246 RepID=M1WK23_PSEP2|nr:protein of unknown function [Pseudodesulfovibrio piezophilus C1TLV30]
MLGDLGAGLWGGDGLGDSSVTNAARASLNAHNLPGLQLVADLLQVRHETAFGLDVGVADIVAALGTFTTYIANLGHCDLLAYSYRIVCFSC